MRRLGRAKHPPEEHLGERLVAMLAAEAKSTGLPDPEFFHEVTIGSNRVDLVVRYSSGSVEIFELKQKPCLALLDQAVEWEGAAHRVWCVTWTAKSRAFQRATGALGFGWIRIHPDTGPVRHPSWPHLVMLPTRHTDPPFLDRTIRALNEGQKTHARAGTNGGHWAPWRDTVAAIGAYLAENGNRALLGTTLKAIKHHWAGAGHSACQRLVDRGLVPGVTMERGADKRIYLVRAP